MTINNKVMSQAEIDAMLAQTASSGAAGESGIEPPENRPEVPNASPVRTFRPESPPTSPLRTFTDRPETPAGSTVRTFTDNKSPDLMADILARIKALEAGSSKMNSGEEEKLAGISEAIEGLQDNIQVLSIYISNIMKEVDAIRHKAQASPTYDLHNTFVCQSCQTAGMITSAVKCTQCGWEGWWGWYPP